jgi:hypothetical protein
VETFTVLCLGAGVQSTTLFLLAQDGEIGRVDLAIFADTQAEPSAIYRHVEWLRTQIKPNGPRLHVCSAGSLRDDAIRGRNEKGFAPSIPVFLADESGRRVGIARRHCTRDYKIAPIHQAMRTELLGLRKYQRWPKDVRVIQLFGISVDEAGRASRIASRVKTTGRDNCEARFPLIEDEMTRADCVAYLKDRVPYEVPRSACTFCPYHNDREWAKLKQTEDWQAIVDFDRALRNGAACGRGLTHTPYLHRSCKPIGEVEFSEDANDGFNVDCEGGCGL